MSLLKNGDGVKVSTFEEVPGNTSYKIKEYIDLNGMSIPIFNVDSDYKTELKLKDTIVIQANLDYYNGYLFGNWTGGNISNEMCIFKSGNQVLWFLGQGGTTQNQIIYARVTYQSGIHLYGFSNGKAIYDNQILSSEQTIDENLNITSNKQHPSYFSIGGTASGNCKVYRIIVNCSSTHKTYSYYPCSDGTNKYIYEALATGRFVYQSDYTSSGTNTPLNFNSAIVGNNVKYGISLDDIKSITGSKYRDLMAIITEDSGARISENAHAPFIIKETNNTEHQFAFYIGTSNETNKIPVNNIYNVNDNSFSIYKPGDLIFGRRPKWNIWANCMPYSIWIRPKQDYANPYERDPSKLVYATYNLIHHWGKNGYVNLSDWENYSYDDASAPGVEFLKKNGNNQYVPIEYSSDRIEIPYHNGYSCYCDIPLPGLWWDNSGSGSSNSNRMFTNMLDKSSSIYMNHNIFPDTGVKMKAGNIINWNTSQIDQHDEDPYYVNQLIYGLCATLSHEFKTLLSTSLGLGSDPVTTNIIIGYRTAQTTDLQSGLSSQNRLNTGTLLVALSSDSTQNTKDAFKDGFIYPDIRVTGNEPIRLFNEIISAVDNAKQHTYTIDAAGDLSLIRASRILDQSETPLDTDLVYLTDFIPKGKIQIKGSFDKYEIDLNPISTAAQNANVAFSSPNSNSGNNLRLIFMNSNTAIVGEDSNHNPIYSSKDLQYLQHNPNSTITNIPLFFFPVGYEQKNTTSNSQLARAGSYTVDHYIKNNDYINIPFVLTKSNLNSYQALLSNSSNDNQYTESNTISNLRLYAEAIWCYEDSNNEKVIVKDKFTKVLNKITPAEYGSDASGLGENENIFGYKKEIYDGSNHTYSECKGINCRPYYWMIEILKSDLKNICNNGTTNIPDDLTVKFWIQNEDISSTVLTYSGDFKYEAINDSWYAPILGESLYLFVKDSPDNKWMNSAFETDEARIYGNTNYRGFATKYEILATHWFKGKKINMFKFSNTTPELLPSGGTFGNPMATTTNGWVDTVPNETFTKLWMTDRFYANTNNDVSNIASTIFTDASWTEPVEIYEDDTTNQKPVFEIAVRNGFTLTENNFNDYVAYRENEGYYGVSRNGVVYTIVIRFDLQDDGTYNQSFDYINAGDNSIGHIDYETYSQDFCTQIGEHSYSANIQYLAINSDQSLQFLTDEIFDNYIDNARLEDNSTRTYSIYNKYMFSINSCQSPLSEPNKWITFDQFKTINNRSDYNFMYHERTLFTLLGGQCYKVFDIIQIGGEQTEENFYPVKMKDYEKLNDMAATLNHERYWYKIGGPNNSNKIEVDQYNNRRIDGDILAPYKVNGLNVSIQDIVQYQQSMHIYPLGDSISSVTGRNCQLNISI